MCEQSETIAMQNAPNEGYRGECHPTHGKSHDAQWWHREQSRMDEDHCLEVQ